MKTIDLTTGDEKKLLIKMTTPMVWALLAAIGMSLADAFFVGQLGADELAAIGFTFPVVMIVMSLSFGFGIGVSSLVSRAIGNKELSKATMYTTQSLCIATITAVVIAIIGVLTIRPVFLALGAPETLMPLLREYMMAWYFGNFSTMILMVGNAAIRATGNIKLPSRIMIGASIINLILDPMFIFGWFGIPKMGLFGAAIATVIASMVAMCATLYILKTKLGFLSLKHGAVHFIKHTKDILQLALPAALASLIAPVGMAIATKQVANYGSDAVAGFSVATRIESFALIIIMALSSVITSFAGQNWGAKRIDRLIKGFNASVKFSMIWAAIIAIGMWLFATPLVQLFTTQPEIVKAGSLYLLMAPITYGFVGIVLLVSSVSNGIGYTKPALLMAFCRLILLYLPLAVFFSQLFGLIGLYGATVVANSVVGIVAYLWSRKKSKSYDSITHTF